MQPINEDSKTSCAADLLLVPGALTPGECRALIARLEGVGFEPMRGVYPPGYRDNDRCVLDDDGLAQRLFDRLADRLPAEVVDAAGQRWELSSLNPRFRACRYRRGQSFCLHRDGAWAPSDRERSFRTLMIYLNDQGEFEGGGTRFYEDRDAFPEVARRLTPATGSVAIFGHDLWHDGEAVDVGTKYVLRTDLIYRRAALGPRPLGGHRGYVWDAAELADGRLVTGSRDGTLGLWWVGDVLTWIDRLPGPGGSVTALVALADGGFVSGGRDGRLHRWQPDGDGFRVVASRQAHAGCVLVLRRVGREVVSAGADGTIARWRVDAGRLEPGARAAVTAGPSWVWAMDDDGRHGVWLADDAGRLCHLDAELKVVAAYRLPSEVGVRSLVCADDGTLALGCEDGSVFVRFTDSDAWHPLWTHRAAVCAVVVDDRQVISGGEDGTIYRGGPAGRVEVRHHQDFVTSLRIHSSGRLVSTSYDGSVSIG